MIEIENLKEKHIGRYVTYTDGIGNKTLGRIKSWNDMFVFVVYNCADEWDNYRDYTAASTKPEDLNFEKLEPEEDVIHDRTEILDL